MYAIEKVEGAFLVVRKVTSLKAKYYFSGYTDNQPVWTARLFNGARLTLDGAVRELEMLLGLPIKVRRASTK